MVYSGDHDEFQRLTDPYQRELLVHCCRILGSFEDAEDTLQEALLREDAVLTMPPVTAWFQGRAAIQAFVQEFLFARQPQTGYRLVATRANGCPAFAVYERDAAGVFRPAALHLLLITADGIARIDDFLTFDGQFFRRFNLPLLV